MTAAAAIGYRRATPDDALCLGVLALQVFLDTYAVNGIRPDLAREALNVYGVEVFAGRLRDPAVEITVAESAGHLVGFVDVSLATACPVAGLAGAEVLRLYVQAPFQRRGIGKALLAIAEQDAQRRGDACVWLTAWVGNAAALAFYPDAGYADAGTTHYVIEGQAYENRVFARRFGP